ncbi:MAG TPA: hypothetical protein VGJ60_25115 [Chloroflexota bacterium]|jgi:hypothetical protein
MAATVDVNAAPEIGVGLVGYAFMGKAHTNASDQQRWYSTSCVTATVLISIGKDRTHHFFTVFNLNLFL